jgi:hypothetical protein
MIDKIVILGGITLAKNAALVVVERYTTGPNWMDAMDDSPDRSACQPFIVV